MKKLLSFVLCAALLLTAIVMVTTVHAATSGTCGAGLTWSYDTSAKVLTISGTGDMYDYSYDDFASGYPVSTPWASYYKNIVSVVIEEGVTSIGDYAFYSATALTSVAIPGSVKTIGEYAFRSCNGLTDLVIPEGVTTIKDNAFYYAQGLENVSFPNSLTSVGFDIFGYAPNIQYYEYENAYYLGNESNNYVVLVRAITKDITTITINENTKIILSSAFAGCNSVKKVTIPNGITSVGIYAFSIKNLEELTLGYVPLDMYQVFKEGLKSLKKITISEGVTSIPEYYFYHTDCYSLLESVTLPSTLTTIGKHAFASCYALNKVYVTSLEYWLNNSVSAFGNFTLYIDGEPLTDLVIPSGVTVIRDKAFSSCAGLNSVTILDGVTTIGQNAFSACRGLTSITIPDSVTSIGNGAFSGCTALAEASIGKGVKTIGDSAFANTGIESVVLPEGTTSIGADTFKNCVSLGSAEFGASLTSIGSGAFTGCSALTSVTFKSTPLVYSNAFNGCTALTDVYVVGTRDDWNDIKMNAEDGNTALKQATVHYIDSNPCALGHDYVVTVVPATARDKGYTLHTCSRCGDFYKDQFTPVISNTDAVIKVVAPGRVLAGSVFTVDVKAENNPGINAFSIAINYDHNSFTLNGAEVNHDIGGRFVFTQKAVWVSAGDYTGDGVLFTLTFTANDDIELGDKYISLNWEPTDITNFFEDEVAFNMNPAVISAADSDHMPGDINGDGAVNTKDLTRLIRVLAGDDISHVEEALDVNGDGEVNIKDLVRLMKYLSGDNVVIY